MNEYPFKFQRFSSYPSTDADKRAVADQKQMTSSKRRSSSTHCPPRQRVYWIQEYIDNCLRHYTESLLPYPSIAPCRDSFNLL